MNAREIWYRSASVRYVASFRGPHKLWQTTTAFRTADGAQLRMIRDIRRLDPFQRMRDVGVPPCGQ